MAGGRELPRWAPAALSAGPVALALALRINGLDWGSPDFFEEAIPLRRAWDLWPWLPGETFDGNPHYFRYPSLVLYLNFLLQAAMYAWLKLGGAIQGTMDFRVLREIDPAAFFLPARSLSVAFATGSVWMVGRLGRRLDGALVGTAAALLTAVNVLHVDWSQRISVDMALAFFSLWALLRCVMLAESVTVRRGVLAGVAVGLATSSKYTGALLLVPLLAAVLPTRREAVGPAVRSLVAAGAAAAIVFAATSPWVIADFRAAWLDIAAEREHMEVGHFGLSSGAAWPFYAKALAGRLLGPLAAAGVAIGLAAAVLRRDRRALVVLSFVAVTLAVVGSWSMRADRYLLPVVAPLLLFAAWAPREAHRALQSRGTAAGPALAAAVAILVALAAPNVLGLPSLYVRMERDVRHLAMEFVEESFPAGSFLVTEAYGPPVRTTEDLLRLPPDVLSAIVRTQPDRPVYASVVLPMSQVYPETSAPFYDLRLYQDADAIIVTSGIADRYLAEPDRFPRQVEFYRALETRFRRVADLTSQAGENIRIYTDGLERPSFRSRGAIRGPVPHEGDGGGLAPGFWFAMGFAYETCNHFPEAATAYDIGLKSPLFAPGHYSRLATGMSRSLALMGHRDRAADFLDSAEAVAPFPQDRAAIQRFRGTLPMIPGP